MWNCCVCGDQGGRRALCITSTRRDTVKLGKVAVHFQPDPDDQSTCPPLHQANGYIQLSSRLTSELENQSENEVHMADGRHDAPLSSVTTVPCHDFLKALFLSRQESSSNYTIIWPHRDTLPVSIPWCLHCLRGGDPLSSMWARLEMSGLWRVLHDGQALPHLDTWFAWSLVLLANTCVKSWRRDVSTWQLYV